MRRGTIRCFSALRRVKTRNTRRTARLVRRERRAGPLEEEEEGGLVVLFHGFFFLFFPSFPCHEFYPGFCVYHEESLAI